MVWADPARLRTVAAWALSAALLIAYVVLGEGEEAALDDEPSGDAGEARQLEIESVKPSDPYPGSSLIVSYDGEVDPALVHVYAAKTDLPVVARRAGSVVARLPADIAAGDVKVRLAVAEQLGASDHATKRSKPYHVRVKPIRWRKIFRDAAGGFALLVLGIRFFTRGAREATGLGDARKLARALRRGWAALVLGVLLGGAAQSTTAAAGVLGGLVSSSLIAVAPAALAFLGAQLGAVAAPLALSGLIAPRDALVLVAFGVLWSALARARRARAFARLLLGAGLIAYGLQVMRPSAEPFALHPLLMSIGAELRADGVVASIRCALLGAGLVAVLQGPMPVIVLVLAVAHTTGRWDLHTAFALLAGTGLGAALSALVITPGGARCRELARVNLMLGAASSALALAGAPLWCALAERWAGGDGAAAAEAWQAHALPLAIAFLSAQLSCALLLLPVAGRLVRRLPTPGRDAPVAHDAAQVRVTLLAVIDDQRAALAATFDLAQNGMRDDGDAGERRLESARGALDRLLRDPLGGGAEPAALEPLARLAFGSVQLQRALERLLFEVESLTDRRIGEDSSDVPAVTGAAGPDERLLHEMQALLDSGLEALRQSLRGATALDLDAAREREIGMNAIEAQVRAELPARHARPDSELRLHGLLRVIDAYESAGNQVYRLAEVLGEAPALEPIGALAPRQPS